MSDAADSRRPPEAARSAARAALEMRESQPPSERGGTLVGLARAHQIARGSALSMDTIRRMASFFARHEKSPGSAEARQDRSSKAAQAWGLWGGSAGKSWAQSIVDAEKNKIDEK